MNLKNVNPTYVNKYSYLTVMGSRAYKTSTPTSDWDFYGFVVPPKEELFPHLRGMVPGFGRNVQRFEQLQLQHVPDPFYGEFDVTIYNIVKYFQLVMEGNPNMVDSLFTDETCLKFSDNVGRLVKDNRHLFLSQKMYHTFKGMLWSHLSRLKGGHVKEGRKELEETYGYDTKDAYHSVRMVLEIEQVLFTGDLDLTKNSELLMEVRSGQHTKDNVISFVEYSLKQLENRVLSECAVPYAPNEDSLQNLLVCCLEEKYGSLSGFGFGSL